MSARILSFMNQKGGVGKTINTIHVGYYLAKSGYKVLLIDMDTQEDLTFGVGIDQANQTIVDFLENKKFAFTVSSFYPNLKIIPGDQDFESNKYRIKSLKDKLDAYRNKFDYILIDCPPEKINKSNSVSGGDLALLASDYLVVPIRHELKSIKNLSTFLNNFFELQEKNKVNITLLGCIFSSVLVTTKRFKMFRNMLNEQGYEDYQFNSYIRQDAVISQAYHEGVSIFDNFPNSRVSKDFSKFTKELIQKMENHEK